ncbi:MAG: hypothetical protein FJ095_10825 [Deltaproteobacteria bacterium]|nr:hypothetical protein [Deltaproteobacteria bacterium]
MRLLVTGSGTPYALELIRKLGRERHALFAADARRRAVGSRSRFTRRAFVTPPHRKSPSDFVARVVRICRAHQIETILPTFDESQVLAAHLEELPCPLFAPSVALSRSLADRCDLAERARTLGLRVPATRVVTSRDELLAAATNVGDCVARHATGWTRAHGVTRRAGEREVETFDRATPTAEERWVVQAYISGLDVHTYSVAREGRVSAHATFMHTSPRRRRARRGLRVGDGARHARGRASARGSDRLRRATVARPLARW